MRQSLWDKIESIRKEPEAVRMRYVFGSVFVVMIFIVGIWALSVQENFVRTAEDFPDMVEQGKQDVTGGVPSLGDLFEQSAPLRIEGNETRGNQFFDQQVSGRQSLPEDGIAVPQSGN